MISNINKWVCILLLSIVFACQNSNSEINSDQVDVEEIKTHKNKSNVFKKDTVSNYAHSLYWHWEDEFSDSTKAKLQTWIEIVTEASFNCIGYYQFDIHYYFHLSDGNEPVPFGHTSRKDEQAVHFYVNPRFSLDDFLADWTAPHEISHLSTCFVGRKNMWFSEGYATYLSRQIMVDMGCFTDESFDSLYLKKINGIKKYYNSSTSSFIEVTDSLLSHYRYGPVYWAGSSFFFTADRYLQENYQIRFTDLVNSYQSCCRLDDHYLKAVIESYDLLLDDQYFSSLMAKYRNSKSSVVMANY